MYVWMDKHAHHRPAFILSLFHFKVLKKNHVRFYVQYIYSLVMSHEKTNTIAEWHVRRAPRGCLC